MRIDYSHLNAIEARIAHEQSRMAAAVHSRNACKDGSRSFLRLNAEVTFREREIIAAEKEKAAERKFLGLPEVDPIDTMTVDELLAELTV